MPVCTICENEYTNNSNLQRHMQLKHPEDVQDQEDSDNDEDEDDDDSYVADDDIICQLLVDSVEDNEDIKSAEDMLENYEDVKDAFKNQVQVGKTTKQ